MPRAKKPSGRPQPVVPTTALMASAHRYSGKAPRIYAPSKEWQIRAYHHYSMCGEARFAARYFGHALSRAVLGVADADGKPLTSGPSYDALQALFAGPDGQAQMLELVGVHLTVGGECYLVGREIDGVDIWEVVSALEIQSGQAGWQIKSTDSDTWVPLSDADVVIRVWLPKPDSRWEADSSFRSMLPVLDEIEWMSRYIHAQATSRLAGAGLLFVPEGITFPPAPPQDGKEVEYANDADAFMAMLGELMMEPILDPSSPSAMVPGVVSAPAEAIAEIKHLTFWTDLDENARAMRQDAIHRFALGMDLPPEMILGMGSNSGTGGGRSNGVSHWGAWQIEEQTIKMHVEPMLDVFRAAVTSSYIRILDGGETDTVTADTTALRLRPDRSKEALELWDRGVIGDLTLLAENGFAETDAITDTERKDFYLRKIALGSATPDQVQAALALMGIDLPVQAGPWDPNDTGQNPNGEQQISDLRETRPAPGLGDHPTRDLPEYAACEALVLRALERAGNRLRNIHQIKTTGPSFEAHTHIRANGTAAQCMEDAWATAEIVLGDKSKDVVPVLHNYCLHLMDQGVPHSRTEMIQWLNGEFM